MESFDLDIDNYDLNDLLNLFNIPFNFDDEDLKNCKRRVFMSHPDKSGLEKDYFLFFSKAYNILVNIYHFKNKKDGDTNYNVNNVDKDKYEAIKRFTNSDNFLKEFNKLFEENKLTDDFRDNGYGDWLKQESNKEILELNNKNLSKSERYEKINKLKQMNHQIIEYENIGEYQTNNEGFSHLINNKPSSYGSGNIFSKFQYEDLKTAHETSLIPVLNSDKRKENYKSIGDLKYARGQQIKPLTKKESIEYLKNKQINMEKQDTLRAYKLAKQTQEAQYINMKTEGYFNRITY